MKYRVIIICMMLISGCAALSSREPFQMYSPNSDCVSCKKQERWGFIKRIIYRNDEYINFALFSPKRFNLNIEEIGLCLGTALDTLKSGNTHFQILNMEKWGDWYYSKTPARIEIGLYGQGTITEGRTERFNRDLSPSDLGATRHYYKTGRPKNCTRSVHTNFDTCSTRHKFDLADCPHEGEELRKKTEQQRGSLACIMKRNPRLLLNPVYLDERDCGYEWDGWIPAVDVLKKYGGFFYIDE